jgi:hypothetical protein
MEAPQTLRWKDSILIGMGVDSVPQTGAAFRQSGAERGPADSDFAVNDRVY